MVGRPSAPPAAPLPAPPAGSSTPTTPTVWIVAFCGGGRRHWWDVFTRPGFPHVLACGYDPARAVWLVYEVSLAGTALALLDGAALDRLIAALRRDGEARFLRWPAHAVRPEAGRPAVCRLGFYCVPAVAHLLGLRCRALSPLGLYRHLLAAGAQPAFEPDP